MQDLQKKRATSSFNLTKELSMLKHYKLLVISIVSALVVVPGSIASTAHAQSFLERMRDAARNMVYVNCKRVQNKRKYGNPAEEMLNLALPFISERHCQNQADYSKMDPPPRNWNVDDWLREVPHFTHSHRMPNVGVCTDVTVFNWRAREFTSICESQIGPGFNNNDGVTCEDGHVEEFFNQCPEVKRWKEG